MTYEQAISLSIEQFGYVVIAYSFNPEYWDGLERPDDPYVAGIETCTIWDKFAAASFTVIAPAMRTDWIKQNLFLIQQGAKLPPHAVDPPNGRFFAKLVPTSSNLNPFREKAHAGGNGE